MEREMMVVNSDRDSISIIGAGTQISVYQDDRELWLAELEDATVAGALERYRTRAEARNALEGLIDAYNRGATVYVMPAPTGGES